MPLFRFVSRDMEYGRARETDFYPIAATAVVVLLLGITYCWIARPQGNAAFLAFLPAFPLDHYPIFFSRWFGWLPTFTHVCAFSLLTYLALGSSHMLFACMLWGGINALYELGQALPLEIIQLLPDIYNVQACFSKGVFDPLDLAACVMGASAAWAIFGNRASQQRESL